VISEQLHPIGEGGLAFGEDYSRIKTHMSSSNATILLPKLLHHRLSMLRSCIHNSGLASALLRKTQRHVCIIYAKNLEAHGDSKLQTQMAKTTAAAYNPNSLSSLQLATFESRVDR
jgi:hypothetical protein